MATIRRRQRRADEVPVTVAVDAVLAESEDLVVCLSGVRVFTTGLDLRLMAMARTADARHRRAGLGGALFGHGDPQDRLLLGVEYADGRAGTNVRGMGPGSRSRS